MTKNETCLHRSIATMSDITTGKPTAWVCTSCWARFTPDEHNEKLAEAWNAALDKAVELIEWHGENTKDLLGELEMSRK